MLFISITTITTVWWKNWQIARYQFDVILNIQDKHFYYNYNTETILLITVTVIMKDSAKIWLPSNPDFVSPIPTSWVKITKSLIKFKTTLRMNQSERWVLRAASVLSMRVSSNAKSLNSALHKKWHSRLYLRDKNVMEAKETLWQRQIRFYFV